MGGTAAARAHIYWVGKDPKTRERVQNWPVGPALLEVLGDLNAEVRKALENERARLREAGYPEDLPLPALWQAPDSPYAQRRSLTGGALGTGCRSSVFPAFTVLPSELT
jgi:hypothetical protein